MAISKSCILSIFVSLILLVNTNATAQRTVPKKELVKLSLTSYEKYIDDNNERQLNEFMELVSIPSISSLPANKADVDKAAEWIVNKPTT